MASSMSSEQKVEELRDIYYGRMSKYFSDMVHEKFYSSSWGSQLWIDNMIKIIKKAKINASNVDPEIDLSVLLNTFIVDCKGGKEILVRVVNTGAVQYKLQVVPWEDSFDIIMQAHVASNHGDIVSTKHHLKSNELCVNSKCLQTFIDLCAVCKQKELCEQNDLTFNRAGVFQVVDMSSTPDGEFFYILVYEDVDTQLTQLRGLMQNCDFEIAMELFKIFMDLGPPKTLMAHKGDHHINIIKMINKLCYPSAIMFHEREHILDKASQIKSLVNRWMRKCYSSHWEIGCHVIQWEINNIKNGAQSPYITVFGRNIVPENSECRKVNAPSNSIAQSLHTEEDLGVFKDDNIKYDIEDSIHISDGVSDSEVVEESLIKIDKELDTQNKGSDNENVDSMKQTVHLISVGNVANPLETEEECELTEPLDDNNLHRAKQILPDIEEELIEVPAEDEADAQRNVDPLATVKDENTSMGCVNPIMQNVNPSIDDLNKLIYAGTDHTSEANDSNIEGVDTSKAAMDNSDTLNACSISMDTEEDLTHFDCISKVASNKNAQDKPICNMCNTIISTTVYTCVTCMKKIHLFCCRRVTGVSSAIPIVICIFCDKGMS